MRNRLLLLITVLIIGGQYVVNAQIASTSDDFVVQSISDRNVPFNVTDPGVAKTVEFGPDLAWDNEHNFRRAVLFMGIDQVDLARLSFTPLEPLINGTDLTAEQIKELDFRLNIVNSYTNASTKVALNCDHDAPVETGLDGVDAWYRDYPARWAQLIDQTTKYVQDAGRTVVSVAPFNEPDYGWNQYSSAVDGKAAFYDICGELRNNSRFDNIRISGGNTLNCDEALPWYNYLKDRLDEGNTHQLAGSFDGYANFVQTVRTDGKHASLDELHNIVEALVGYEYGMQTGVWWADIDLASGEMVKAFDGERIGYAEHREKWTAAAVYRTPEGKIQAFGGTSERQAKTTTYNFISKDRPVYFDGLGPMRVFALTMPGGTGYGQGQTNAERVVNITWGEDIQPAINGTYQLVNRASGQVLEVAGDYNEANVYQATASAITRQQWLVTPVDSRIGGDFSYYRIKPASSSNRYLDLYGFSLDPGGKISIWDIGYYGNQQWYFDYAEDGWFYIRSRESSYCAEVNDLGNLVQGEKNGTDNQQWRLIPVDAPVEFDAPSAPQDLVASANAVSVKLIWTASPETDVAGYDILRSASAGGEYNTIARDVNATSFIDNTVSAGEQYYYKLKAVDKSLNHSAYSTEVSSAATGENDLVEYLKFDGDTKDNSINLNHAAANGGTFVTGRQGTEALSLNGSSDFVQLPEDIANHQEISVVTWVNWAGFSIGQYLFSFSDGADNLMYFSPSISGQMQLAIQKDGVLQKLNSSALSANTWVHLTITLGNDGAAIYLNGEKVAESATMTLRPSDINPLVNYIGVNQSTKKLFQGVIDDFRIYNYQLSPTQVKGLYDDLTTAVYDRVMEESDLSVWPNPADDIMHISYMEYSKREKSNLQLLNMSGATVMNININSSGTNDLDVSNLTAGIYLLRLTTSEGTISRKVIIRH